MCAGEAENPRKAIPKAIRYVSNLVDETGVKRSFDRRVFWRLAAFYILGILCVGILIASNDPDLLDGIANGTGEYIFSPYVQFLNR